MDSTLLLMMAKFLLNDDLGGKSELFFWLEKYSPYLDYTGV